MPKDCEDESKNLAVSYSASDFMTIDGERCECGVGGGLSGIKNSQTAPV